MNWKSLLFGFRGRINRGKYWLAILINLVVWLLAAGAFAVGMSIASAAIPLMLIGSALLAIMFWSSTVIAIKRLHDRNKTGWWLVFFYVVPALLSPVATVTGNSTGILAAQIAAAMIGLWYVIELGFFRGTSGPNRFGHDPILTENIPMRQEPA